MTFLELKILCGMAKVVGLTPAELQKLVGGMDNESKLAYIEGLYDVARAKVICEL